MKRTNYLLGGGAVLAALVLGALSTSSSQADHHKQANGDYQNPHSKGHMVRASQIIGHAIVNPQDEGVGEISDLVVDPNSGKIRYAAVTYGGFVGLGNKMFAVPWEAFECRQSGEDADEYKVMLDIRQEQLEEAEGFNEENWPNFADRNFTNKLDKRYKVERSSQRDRARVGVNVGRGGVDVDVDDE